MPWKLSDRLQMLEDFWRDGTSICPDCGTTVDLKLTLTNGYLVNASCPRGCGSFSADREHDPRSAKFRPWTLEESAEVLQFRPAYCPLDGTKIDVSEVQGKQVLTCHRCGNATSKPVRKVPKVRKWQASAARKKTRKK